ncbi:unnamed protein product [Closterium sp. Naga37s-1]|nr:unnamed protein product [Closterium sp. Naga37s-1]
MVKPCSGPSRHCHSAALSLPFPPPLTPHKLSLRCRLSPPPTPHFVVSSPRSSHYPPLHSHAISPLSSPSHAPFLCHLLSTPPSHCAIPSTPAPHHSPHCPSSIPSQGTARHRPATNAPFIFVRPSSPRSFIHSSLAQPHATSTISPFAFVQHQDSGRHDPAQSQVHRLLCGDCQARAAMIDAQGRQGVGGAQCGAVRQTKSVGGQLQRRHSCPPNKRAGAHRGADIGGNPSPRQPLHPALAAVAAVPASGVHEVRVCLVFPLHLIRPIHTTLVGLTCPCFPFTSCPLHFTSTDLCLTRMVFC